MEDKFLPSSRTAVHVNTSGAAIVEDDDDIYHSNGGDGDGGAGSSSISNSSISSNRVEAAVFGSVGSLNGQPDAPGARDSRDIYLPKHTEWISHVAIDIGGSLAKVVYFSRAPYSPVNGYGYVNGNGNGKGKAREDSHGYNSPRVPLRSPLDSRPASPSGRTTPIPNGVLGPESIASSSSIKSYFEKNPNAAHGGHVYGTGGVGHPSHLHDSYTSDETSSTLHTTPTAKATSSTASSTKRPPPAHLRSASVHNHINGMHPIPGGYLNFTKFETGDITSCIEFINCLIEESSASHSIDAHEFRRKHVKIMATGGGAHLFYDRLSEELQVEVRKEEEMECLIAGLTFFMEIPHEVFWYSDQLVHSISHPPPNNKCSMNSPTSASAPLPPLPPTSTTSSQSDLAPTPQDDLPRPSPNPPQYSLVYDEHPTPQFPCMLVNIGSGVSIIKVDVDGKYERISGTSLGGGTLWGLLSLLTGADSFDEMLALSEKGDNANVDMMVGDIYGSDYSKIGLKSSTIASSFGKVFRKGNKGKKFNPEDIAKSLLYAVSNNIGQIAYMNAEKHNLDRIYFGGCFIRGHAATISTLSYAIRFWSRGTKRALFLRHEGYLGAIGAWLRNIEEEDVRRTDTVWK